MSGSSGPGPATNSVEPPPMSTMRKGASRRHRGRRVHRPSTVVLPRFRPAARAWFRPPPPLAGGTRLRWWRHAPPRWPPTGYGPHPDAPSLAGTPGGPTGTGPWLRRELARCIDPSPSRVMRMRRSRGWPLASTMNSRVEFVPQSIAATGPTGRITLCYHDGGRTAPPLSRSAAACLSLYPPQSRSR